MSDNPEEAAYYLRLVSFYMDLCTESVRKVFNFHSPRNNGVDFIRSNQAKLNELKRKGILNQQECEVVITQWPNLGLTDVSLLITLSINLFTTVQLPPPKKGWDRPPKGKDTSIAADLLRLRKIRNVIVGHHPCAQLSQWEFEKEWENIETILLRIERQIDPGNEVHLQSQIECYLIQQLQPCIQNEHGRKLKKWYQEVSKAQKQVNEYLKNLEGFNVYLKEKSDRYERYITLLVKGGRFVMSALIKTKCQQSSLRRKLDEKEDILREKITDTEHLEILYPSASDRFAIPLDLSVWDISLLAGVLLYAFECSDDLKKAIGKLFDAGKNYAEVAVISLDPEAFFECLYDLKCSIDVAKNYLNSEEKSHINEILEESKKKAKEVGSFKAYMEELKSQGLQMKTFSDIHKETVQKTKKKLQEMITHGISFDSNRMLELKMITVGSDEEKKKIAENILLEVWQTALDRTENKHHFQDIQEEVNKILKELKSKNIQNISVEQRCILLQIASREPCDMLALIEYFDSDLFHKTLDDICKEVGYHCDTIVAICSNVTIESLHGILNAQILPEQQESCIRVPITVSSPTSMKNLWKLFRSEQFSNSTNAIAEKLSKHSNTSVTLKTKVDMKELNGVFDGETEQSSTDSESNDSLSQDSSRNTELYFSYKGDVAGHSADQLSQYNKQKQLSEIESAKQEAIPDDHLKNFDYGKQKKETDQSNTDRESNDSLTQDSSRKLDSESDFPYKDDAAGHPADQSSVYDKQTHEIDGVKIKSIPDYHQKHLDYVKQEKATEPGRGKGLRKRKMTICEDQVLNKMMRRLMSDLISHVTLDRRECLLDERPSSSGTGMQGITSGSLNLRKTDFTVGPLPASIVMKSAEALNSVGSLEGGKCTGTIFRVGRQYAMTAAHVIDSIINPHNVKGREDLSQMTHCCVKFHEQGKIFSLKPVFHFKDNKLDVAIIEFIDSDILKLPPPLQLMKDDVSSALKLAVIIGYGNPEHPGKLQETGVDVISNKEITEFVKPHSTALKIYGGSADIVETGYSGYEADTHMLLKCIMGPGASGSPVFTTEFPESLKVAGLFICGYPKMYNEFPDSVQKEFPLEFTFEAATKTSAIYDALCKHDKTKIAKAIFER